MELELGAKHLKATKADDAKVDLTMWSLPNEALKESWAGEVLMKCSH